MTPLFNPLSLTPSQEATVESAIKLIDHFDLLVIRGDINSGKHTVATEIFNRLHASVVKFDLCEIATSITTPLTNQSVIDYFDDLLQQVRAYVTPTNGPRHHSKRSRVEDDLANLSLQTSPRQLGIIYIRNYNRIVDVLSDCYAKLRHLLPLIIRRLVEKLPSNVKIVMTTYGCILSDYQHWCLELPTTREDMVHVLDADSRLAVADREAILNLSKIIPIGRIVYCLKYAWAMHPPSEISALEQYSETWGHSSPTSFSFIESYQTALSKFSGSSVEVDKDVPHLIAEEDLVGMEEVLDEITTSIINPMRLGIPGIPIKKGLLLCGPPGTGKTSVGRWLAHQLKGKFYLIGGEVGINGSQLIDCFTSTVRRARENSPAVIFIDDCDVLFEQNDTYRAFLTILDGIETNKRSDICVIVTCMHLRNVPSSLLRGGRLEMTLITKLPDQRRIGLLLEKALDRMVTHLEVFDPTLSFQIDSEFIRHLAVKMAGWNCADIHRCVNDVSRLIIARKGIRLADLFERCIKQIREQYTLCGRCESTDLQNRPHESYIG